MMLGRAEQAHTDAEWVLDGIEIAAVSRFDPHRA